MVLKCLMDFYMEGGDRAFTAGKKYPLIEKPHYIDGEKHYITFDDGGEYHTMPQSDIDKFFKLQD